MVPEKDLVGCWPLWPQFGPDELRFRCTRSWSADPGQHRPMDYRSKGAPLPCWQTCWAPIGGDVDGGGATAAAAQHCTAACPAQPEGALAWRKRWDGELQAFNSRAGVGRDLASATEFIKPVHQPNFMWDVY